MVSQMKKSSPYNISWPPLSNPFNSTSCSKKQSYRSSACFPFLRCKAHLFGAKNTQLHYRDTDSVVLGVKTKKYITDLRNCEEILDFFNLSENHQLFSNKNKKK